MSFVTRAPYRIETERLVLRPWAPSDAPALAEALAASAEHLAPWLAWAREPAGEEELLERLRRFRAQYDLGSDLALAVLDGADGSLLGGAGWHHRVGPAAAEIGYWVDARHTRRGIATEVAAALTRVGLTVLPYRKLEIRVVPENTASARVPRRLGYRLDGRSRAHVPGRRARDPWRDAEVHSLLREELPGSPAETRAEQVGAFDALGRPLTADGSTNSARE